jgi:hypothetical protein
MLLSSVPFQKLASRGVSKRNHKKSDSSSNNNNNSKSAKSSLPNLTSNNASSKLNNSGVTTKPMKKKKGQLNGMKMRTLDSYFMKLPPTFTQPPTNQSTVSDLSSSASALSLNATNNSDEKENDEMLVTKPKLTIIAPPAKSKSKTMAKSNPVPARHTLFSVSPPPPAFEPFGVAAGNADVVWEKLAVRDFMARCKFIRAKSTTRFVVKT